MHSEPSLLIRRIQSIVASPAFLRSSTLIGDRPCWFNRHRSGDSERSSASNRSRCFLAMGEDALTGTFPRFILCWILKIFEVSYARLFGVAPLWKVLGNALPIA